MKEIEIDGQIFSKNHVVETCTERVQKIWDDPNLTEDYKQAAEDVNIEMIKKFEEKEAKG